MKIDWLKGVCSSLVIDVSCAEESNHLAILFNVLGEGTYFLSCNGVITTFEQKINRL